MFTEQYIGMIAVFPTNSSTAPNGWAFCEGQQIPISEYEPLYTIIGTTYGGDGQTYFALPDMRGRTAIHMGQGPGLQPYPIGHMDGLETLVIDPGQMPSHNHTFISLAASNQPCTSTPGTTNDPDEGFPAPINGSPSNYSTQPSDTSTLGTNYIQPPSILTGGNTAINIVSPYMALRYIICLDGIYPSKGD